MVNGTRTGTGFRAVPLVLGGVLLVVFAVLGLLVRHAPPAADRAAAGAVTGLRSGGLTGVVSAVNLVLAPVLGWVALAALVVAVVVAAVRRRRATAWWLVRVALWYGLTWRAVSQAKDLFDRHRPDAVPRLDHVTGTSYPSGHVAAVAAVGALALLLARRYGRLAPAVPGVVVAVLVTGFDRVYLGVHYPADVAGAVLGVAGTALVLAAVLRPDAGPN